MNSVPRRQEIRCYARAFAPSDLDRVPAVSPTRFADANEGVTKFRRNVAIAKTRFQALQVRLEFDPIRWVPDQALDPRQLKGCLLPHLFLSQEVGAEGGRSASDEGAEKGRAEGDERV